MYVGRFTKKKKIILPNDYKNAVITCILGVMGVYERRVRNACSFACTRADDGNIEAGVLPNHQ